MLHLGSANAKRKKKEKKKGKKRFLFVIINCIYCFRSFPLQLSRHRKHLVFFLKFWITTDCKPRSLCFLTFNSNQQSYFAWSNRQSCRSWGNCEVGFFWRQANNSVHTKHREGLTMEWECVIFVFIIYFRYLK